MFFSVFLRFLRLESITIIIQRLFRQNVGWCQKSYKWGGIYIYENYVLFNKNKTILIAYRSKNSNYTIPKSVSTIGDFAFGGSEYLQKIIIPNSVNSIGDGAFALCCCLENIIIPKSIKIIKQASFYGCKTLTNIDIPQSVTTIKKGAFYGCI